MNNIVGVDTQILIWAIKEQASPTQTEMIGHAKAFFRHLDEERNKVLVPTPVLTEMLMRVPADEHQMVANLCERAFLLAPFDLKAAVTAARIWIALSDDGTIAALRTDDIVSRQEIKTDLMILAVAASRGVRCFYTNDDNLRKLANGFVTVEEMPVLAHQPPLPSLQYPEEATF